METKFITFLSNIFMDTLSMNIAYHQFPYNDIHNVDIGLRNGLQNGDILYNDLKDMMNQIEHNFFYFYSDKFDLNYIFFHPEENKNVLSVGPFLHSNVDRAFINKLTEKHHLKFSEVESVREFLYELPVFSDHMRLTSILVGIMDYLNPNVSFTTKTINTEVDALSDVLYTPIDNFMLKAKATENRYTLEKQLLTAVSRGETNEAISVTRHFMSMLYEPRTTDTIANTKASLYTANTVLRIGAGGSDIHPIYLHELSTKFAKQIHSTDSSILLDKLHEKMVIEYCALVNSKSHIQYSTMISNVLNYIDFNLSQKLSLSVLAEYFHISPPYLSKIFKKEVKQTLTDYINTVRINASLRLLNSTNIMIRDVAAHVGIEDFNYFTKIFKNSIGLTPNQYRAQSSRKL